MFLSKGLLVPCLWVAAKRIDKGWFMCSKNEPWIDAARELTICGPAWSNEAPKSLPSGNGAQSGRGQIGMLIGLLLAGMVFGRGLRVLARGTMNMEPKGSLQRGAFNQESNQQFRSEAWGVCGLLTSCPRGHSFPLAFPRKKTENTTEGMFLSVLDGKQNQRDPKRNPKGNQTESTGHQKDTKRTPTGHQKDTKRTPKGHEKNAKRT